MRGLAWIGDDVCVRERACERVPSLALATRRHAGSFEAAMLLS